MESFGVNIIILKSLLSEIPNKNTLPLDIPNGKIPCDSFFKREAFRRSPTILFIFVALSETSQQL